MQTLCMDIIISSHIEDSNHHLTLHQQLWEMLPCGCLLAYSDAQFLCQNAATAK